MMHMLGMHTDSREATMVHGNQQMWYHHRFLLTEGYPCVHSRTISLQTVRRYGTSQCGQDRDEFTYELTSITKVSTQWYISINTLATSVL